MNDCHQKIIAFLDTSELDRFPSSAIVETKRAVLDIVGCMIAGIDTPLGQGMCKLARRFKDKDGASVLGMKSSVGAAAAAGKLMGLSPKEIIDAMGIAEMQARTAC